TQPTASLRSRPKWPAPPPPVIGNNNGASVLATEQLNTCNSDVLEEISSSLEQLNNLACKSPSIASNDSMTEYGWKTINVEVCDDSCAAGQQMTRSYQEPSRPTRPPPPRNVRRSSSPEGEYRMPSSNSNKTEQARSQETLKTSPPSSQRGNVHRSQSTLSGVPVACTKDNRTLVHLDTDTYPPQHPHHPHQQQQQQSFGPGESSYNTLPKPPLPNKPRSIVDSNKPNEITKL
ncbi:unnamed protein product, partial [Gongylonema pulchrum]|uniref:Erbb2 interacting protein n=1 Tax=Gongylonema pulchrum TaxID=637853 RepID=A0A183E573_9BILA